MDTVALARAEGTNSVHLGNQCGLFPSHARKIVGLILGTAVLAGEYTDRGSG